MSGYEAIENPAGLGQARYAIEDLRADQGHAGAVVSLLDLDRLAGKAADLARGSRSEATWRAYASDWRDFTAWCSLAEFEPLPASPATVGLYLTDRSATHSIATLTRRVSAISVEHRLAGHHLDTRHPAIAAVLAGLRRSKGVAARQVTALTVPLAKRVVATCADRLIDLRDRALILVGLAGGFRRSELVALNVRDVTVSEDGLRIVVRRSKADQDGEGALVGINRTGSATCPVAAYVTWLGGAGISEGRVFRSVSRHGRVGTSLSCRAVALIMERRAYAAGLDATTYSGHSLRSGFATSAAASSVTEYDIMRVTRHRSVRTLRRYIREGNIFSGAISQKIGL